MEGYDLFSNNLSDNILIALHDSDEYEIGPIEDLSGAHLSGTDLSGAKLSGADLTDVIAENITVCPSNFPEGWVCEDNSLIPPPEFFSFKPKEEKKVGKVSKR